MEKLITLSLCAVFAFSLLIFNNLSTANAQDSNIKITTDYNETGFISFTSYDDSDNVIAEGEVTNWDGLEFSFYDANIKKIIFDIKEYIVDTSDYLDNLGVIIVSGDGETSMTKDGDNTFIVDDIDPETFTEIKIQVDVLSFEIKASYLEYVPGDITGTLDNSFIDLYTIQNGVPVKLQKNLENEYWVQYNQVLRFKIADNITLNGNQKSYAFDELYFIQSFPQMKAVKVEGENYFEYLINADFIEEYVLFVGEIRLRAYYIQSFKVDLDFSMNGIAPIVINADTSAVLGQNVFIESGTKLQITFNLAEYVELKRLSDDRPDIEGVFDTVDYEYDLVNNPNNTVKIFVTVTNQSINLKVNLDYAFFTVDSSGSTGIPANCSPNRFQYGDKIEITAAGIGSMDEIKEWTINGISVPNVGESDTVNGIKRVDDTTVQIDTAVWYGAHKNIFTNDISTGTSTKVILIIVVVAVAAVLAVLLLLFLMYRHKHTKHKIKALLEAEQAEHYQHDQSALFADLRADKAYKVSDEEVKARMKDEKHHKDHN